MDRWTEQAELTRRLGGAFAMPSPMVQVTPPHTIPATTDVRTPVSGLPVARTADPAECETLLAIDVDDRGRIAVLRARGEIDMLTVAQLRDAVDDQLTSGAGTVVLDLRDVSFVDCTGIGMLADARRRAARRGIRLRIVPGRAVARTAGLLDLTSVLGLHRR
jgi:anti-sigma B factor antagonist